MVSAGFNSVPNVVVNMNIAVLCAELYC